jgi:hypothetical protein
VKNIKLACIFLFLTVAILFCTGCVKTITEKNFVGKWKSSKLETPIYLYDNGEWEIKTNTGAVLQYGIWQYKAKKITWSFKMDSYIGHDVNPVLSSNLDEFKIQESDGATTTFTRL